MGLEAATYINQLDALNPEFDDVLREADDHMRLIKSTLLNTFPIAAGAMPISGDGSKNPAIKKPVRFYQGDIEAMGLGKEVRLNRLFHHASGRMCAVAVDHFIGYQKGLPPGLTNLSETLSRLEGVVSLRCE